jgi:gamma-glutamyltranspeptidase/glutathione hydrolase
VETGHGDVISSPHHLATAAGFEVMARGGSAVDAAIAVDAMLGVVSPEACGIGGDLFALVWEPGQDAPECLNASGPAGSNARADELRAAGHERVPNFHPLSVTVPGCVAGWSELSERHGQLPLPELLGPAIEVALTGFPASTELAMSLEAAAALLMSQAAATGLYPSGAPPSVGDRLSRPRLADTLEGIAGGGRDAFYRGAAAHAISDAVGGRITPDDLAGYRPEWVEPARLDMFGMTGWTVPPNSQGYLTLATLHIFERLGETDPDDPATVHALVEAYRSVAWERDDLLADPRTAPYGWRELLDPERLAGRTDAIDRDTAGSWPGPAPAPGGTAYMCAVDGRGQAVSLVQSNFAGIGSRIGAGDTGFFLHNRGAGFDLRPGHPNELAAGRRPLHTLSPTLWTAGDRLAAVLGTRGGHQQPQILAQVAAAAFGMGRSVDEVQAAPRWAIDSFGPGSPSVLALEPGFPAAVVEGLERRGHRFEVRPAPQRGWGPVSVITVDETGLRRTSADPRGDTTLAAARG